MVWRYIPEKSKLIRSATVNDAAKHLAYESWTGDRDIKETRLDHHEKIIRDGHSKVYYWDVVHCLEDDKYYRANGAHTATKILELAEEFSGLVVRVEHYECDKVADVGLLWAQYDSALSVRTPTEIYNSISHSYPELADVRKQVLNVIVPGIALHIADGSESAARRLGTTSERADLAYSTYAKFILWFNRIAPSKRGSRFYHVGVIAAMLATWEKSQAAATEFWTAVRDATGATPNKPDRQLAKWFDTTLATRGVGVGLMKSRTAAPREFYVRSLHCWNAFRRGEELQAVKYSDAANIPTIK